MVSRRILRIKLLQELYSHFKSEKTADESLKELMFSIEKTNDLYFYLIQFLIDVSIYAESRIELAKTKRIPTQEDLHPNTRFISNKVIQQFSNNTQVNKYLNSKKMSWANYPELIKQLYLKITESIEYNEYMSKKDHSYKDDKQFIENIYSKIIPEFEPLFNNLEDQSIFWNSEIDFVISFIIKSIKSLKETDHPDKEIITTELVEDDLLFVKRLFAKTIFHFDTYKVVIDKYTTNWDVDRIAFIDILILQMAVNEIVEFPSIPKKVSFNEYIDIAKCFSTPNSSQFINGILDKIIADLETDKKIQKLGRGLIN